ncbi:MAG: DUF3332 domain-containing protein [Candidatus Cloacimonadaceae bacterium]
MKTLLRITALLLVSIMLFNLAGCYGSFTLTRKLYDWNGQVGDKWINSAIMWVFLIIPVYSAASFIDFFLLNTIEFWTGSNPVTMQDGEQSIKFVSDADKTYKITISKNNLNITETEGPDKGKSITLTYSPENGNWIMNDGSTSAVIANMSQAQLKLFYPDGNSRDIDLSR